MITRSATVRFLVLLSASVVAACGSAERKTGQLSGSASINSGSGLSSAATNRPASGTDSLSAQLKTPDGQPVVAVIFDFARGYVTVTVKTVRAGVLAPGFHGMHVHAIGKCEPNSVAPAGGPRGNFLSGGEHYQAPGHTGQPESGDLTPLEVRQDGSALLVTTTDAFTRDELLAGQRTAVMLHGAKYSDNETERIACGVIRTA
ncbi:superoxide dismutase family protein [Mycobacterium sp.]|uniref:superoxide dismutase family protein n=1 Tax=Mycobacterium sp. TaxID=1785 RepID=UPI003BAAB00F